MTDSCLNKNNSVSPFMRLWSWVIEFWNFFTKIPVNKPAIPIWYSFEAWFSHISIFWKDRIWQVLRYFFRFELVSAKDFWSSLSVPATYGIMTFLIPVNQWQMSNFFLKKKNSFQMSVSETLLRLSSSFYISQKLKS